MQKVERVLELAATGYWSGSSIVHHSTCNRTALHGVLVHRTRVHSRASATVFYLYDECSECTVCVFSHHLARLPAALVLYVHALRK